MKRSEMIEKMERSMIAFFHGEQPAKQACYQLLNIIERTGMLPPKEVPKREDFSSDEAFWTVSDSYLQEIINSKWDEE